MASILFSVLFLLQILLLLSAGTGAQHQQRRIPAGERVDCAPRPGDTATDCLARGCLWDEHLAASSSSFSVGVYTTTYFFLAKNTLK
jgi:hypothetical protein